MRRIRSYDSVKIISLDIDALIAELEARAERLKEARQEVEAVYLVGSLARGDFTGFSDADVLIILRESEMNPVERIRDYLPYFDLEVGVDLLIYTSEEVESLLRRKDPHLHRMMRDKLQLA